MSIPAEHRFVFLAVGGGKLNQCIDVVQIVTVRTEGFEFGGFVKGDRFPDEIAVVSTAFGYGEGDIFDPVFGIGSELECLRRSREIAFSLSLRQRAGSCVRGRRHRQRTEASPLDPAG